MSFDLLNIKKYKIIELKSFCINFNLNYKNKTKTQIINLLLNYYLTNNCDNKNICDDIKCKKCYYKSFFSEDKCNYWNYNKNFLHPRFLSKNNKNKYYFLCNKCNHEIYIRLSNICQGNWCSYCGSNKLCQDNECNICFNKSLASHEKSAYWNYIKNKIIPRNVSKYNNKPYWFTCNKCNHDIYMIISNITDKGKWCVYCAHRKLCEDNCDICFNNSFASSDKSKYWDYEKNFINPRDVSKNQNKSYWFKCDDCNHSIYKNLNSITCKNSWCIYCENQDLCEDLQCNYCNPKRFINNIKSNCWDYEKNINKLIKIFNNSSKKYWFICDKCTHSFDITPNSISKGIWCRYCANQDLCQDEECKICFNNSFAGNPLSEFWNYDKNTKIPRNVSKCNGEKFWFNCKDCKNTFEMRISDINKGRGCNICIYTTEKKLYDFLKDNNIEFIKEYCFEDGRYIDTNKKFRYDFYINKYNILIELDGLQHFEKIKWWNNDPILNCIKDCYKMKFIENKHPNIKIIRVLQDDIYYNKILNYKELLLNKIKDIINNKNNENIIYLTDKNIYDNHKKYLKYNLNELYNILENYKQNN
jgi:very-short-patch-repair endonuclease